jgi:hypothetical protein
MFRKTYTLNLIAGFVAALTSCSEDDIAGKKSLRPAIDYATLDAATDYSEQFKDESGTTTVDLTDGNNLHKMFQALNYQSTSAIAANTQVDAEKLHDIFENNGDPFVDISTSTISIVGADLNASDLQLQGHTGSSLSTANQQAIHNYLAVLFDSIGSVSEFVGNTASEGQPGKLGTYLVDGKGIELAQVIQKSLIGALQLDYISNVLLSEGLTAENYVAVAEENYTELEHNWDVAYGLLTLNQIYLENATADARNSVEFALGSYLWEYNRANFAKFYPAFLQGRAAIVNNDATELAEQVLFLRTEMEKAIANAAIGYMNKAKAEPNMDKKAHAFAEGLGFIYSLRFAEIHGADAAFSDDLINDLVGSENGFWDLVDTDYDAAANAIKTKFNIQ